MPVWPAGRATASSGCRTFLVDHCAAFEHAELDTVATSDDLADGPAGDGIGA